MRAGVHNFDCDQGAVWRLRMTARNKETGDPMEWAGYSARMQIRSEYDGSVMAELTVENGRITLDEEGEIRLYLPGSVTADLAHDGIYDLELIRPDSEPERLLKGKFRVSPEVTR